MKNQATSNHGFNIYVAKKVGVNSAVILQNLAFWLKTNEANGTNYFDGRHWSYNSVNAMTEIFIYLSRYQIEKALKDLEDDGYIVSGNYNKMAYDRTKWYSITDEGYGLFESELSISKKLSNALLKKQKWSGNKTEMDYKESEQPIPDINKDINKDINTYNKEGVLEKGLFEKFWKEYPKKVSKGQAEKTFNKLIKEKVITKEVMDLILKDLNKREGFKQWQKDNGKYIPNPSTYLNAKGWLDEYEGLKKESSWKSYRTKEDDAKSVPIEDWKGKELDF